MTAAAFQAQIIQPAGTTDRNRCSSSQQDAKITRNRIKEVSTVSGEARDGLTVDLGGGRWFNLRPSNTEPLLRLNVEAPTRDAMTAIRDEVLALVR